MGMVSQFDFFFKLALKGLTKLAKWLHRLTYLINFIGEASSAFFKDFSE
jgi:hypothetical protein